MLTQYRQEANIRKSQGLPPLPLSASQTKEVTEILQQGNEEQQYLLHLLAERVEPGVSKSAYVKASWLEKIACGVIQAAEVSTEKAVEMLTRMGGGYNVKILLALLQSEALAPQAATGLKSLIKVYDTFDEVVRLAPDNEFAADVLESWAKGEWFSQRPPLPDSIKMVVYKVSGEINTDDFSPGNQAQSRADIPLHAQFFGAKRFPEGTDIIASYRKEGKRVCFAGDVVGTGSSRKSAINSLLWHIGEDIPYVPNKRINGLVLGSTIAPIFYATARDAGVLPVQCDVKDLNTGDSVTLHPHEWKLFRSVGGEEISMQPPPVTLIDEYKAGGRLNLIIGRKLTQAACEVLGREVPSFFSNSTAPSLKVNHGYTLAQKMIGRACDKEGVLPGDVCEPKITTVGSQDTTGPMTMQEVEELACLRFEADLFMQSFCHTAAYPKASDLGRWKSMQETTTDCGGVTLQPGDGVIHSWLNKMLIPDTVGTGGDSHTRFPLGISFPAGSGLVAFAGALGYMPLEIPESVLVRFKGKRRPGITVRDMVNAIPYTAIELGLLTVAKDNKKNIFAGTILEIEGIDDLSVEDAFELSDASAERSAAACTLKLPLVTVEENVRSNVVLLQRLVDEGYNDQQALMRRIGALEKWLENPSLLRADDDAVYKEVIEIDLDTISEPILACPNDPDDVRLLREVAGENIDEAFVGSCMTHLGHLRIAANLLEKGEYLQSRLWVAPATRIDREAMKAEGGLSVFGQSGARVEIPGCSLCMGNQARVQPGVTVISTSTRNFDNRMGDNTRVYLGSTPLTVISAQLGYIPTMEEYLSYLE